MADRVIVVPGFMGSVLVREGNDTPSGTVWLNRSRLLAGEYKYLQLDDAGTGPGPMANGVRLAPGQQLINPGPWEPVLTRLRETGFSPLFFSYDWRKDIRDTAETLANLATVEAAKGPVYVLAYSMGGLIARMAYASSLAAPARPQWKRTVYLGSPQYGSHDAAMYLARAFRDLSLLGIYPPAVAGYITVASIAGLASVINVKVQPIVSTWPALYQLLPDISADWIATRPLDPRLYVKATYTPENPHVRQHWLDVGKDTRLQLNASLSGPRPAERIVLGDGLGTSDGLRRADELGFEDDYTVTDGDGAVALSRGQLPGVTPSLTIAPGPHVSLPTNASFLAALPTLLRDTVVEPGIKGVILLPETPSVPGSTITGIVPGPGIGVQRRGDP